MLCCSWAIACGHEVGCVEIMDAEPLEHRVQQIFSVPLLEAGDCVQNTGQFGVAVHIAAVQNALADLRRVHLVFGFRSNTCVFRDSSGLDSILP